jgi:8-oxo-dGTP diphosphatase
VSGYTLRRQAARVVLLNRDRHVLLLSAADPADRAKPPWWEIPGGGIDPHETSEDAARRELFEETGVRVKKLAQLHTFGDPKRDPRGRNIAVAYLALVNPDDVEPRAGDDAAEVGWFALARPPKLAFDHKDILAVARKYLKARHV